MKMQDLVVTRQRYLISDWETYLYREVLYPTTVTFFMLEVEEISKAKAGDDAEGFNFVPVDAIDAAHLAFKSSRTALHNYREWRKHVNLQ